MPRITIGELKHRIRLQRSTDVVADSGEPMQTWTTYATVWAHVAPISGAERWDRAMLGGSVVYRIYMRHGGSKYSVGIKDRILWDDKVLDVVAVIDINGDHEWLRIEAVEAV